KNNMLAQEQYKNQLQAYQLQRQLAMTNGGPPLSDKQREEVAKQEEAVANLQRGAKENSAALERVSTGDRLQHFGSKITGGIVPDAPVYGELNAGREAMAINANLANGIPTAQTEKQYENMTEGANTPNAPEKGVAFSKSQTATAREALARTYATTYRVPIETGR